jgi:hypothetical protein
MTHTMMKEKSNIPPPIPLSCINFLTGDTIGSVTSCKNLTIGFDKSLTNQDEIALANIRNIKTEINVYRI